MPERDPRFAAPCRNDDVRRRVRREARPAASAVVAAFNTWAFKREQPDDPELLHGVVEQRIGRGAPIAFALYWGKGPRTAPAAPEAACLDYLAAMAERVRQAYAPGAEVRLILTDTHARLNGYSQRDILDYFLAVGEAARSRGFKWCLLSDIVAGHAENLRHICPAERPAGTIAQLERSAARWYKSGGRSRDGAEAYFDMNMIERRAVELEFPDAIFVTFSGSELRELFPPRLPVFYMYSVRKGVSVKPWFMDAEPAASSIYGGRGGA